jgi:uncharacterized protein
VTGPWPQPVLDSVLSRSTFHWSRLHGLDHWHRVTWNGLALAEETPGADAEIAMLFGLFHDSMRKNDGHDPGHGPRAAELADQLSGLTGYRLELLMFACKRHADGEVSSDPTIGVCWDGDRLDLPRVGTRPDVSLMSTVAGRKKARAGDRPPS